MNEFTKLDIVHIARQNGLSLNENWEGPGQVWPLIESMMRDGSVVVLKLDGQREPSAGDNGKYTIIATGGLLGTCAIRGDFESLDSALCYLIGNYAAERTLK